MLRDRSSQFWQVQDPTRAEKADCAPTDRRDAQVHNSKADVLMGDEGFDSPESAAMFGFPAQHCRVIATRVSGDEAYVLLDTGSPGIPYLYGVHCCRRGRWYEPSSSNSGGWTHSGADPRLGTLALWSEAPDGADMVRLEFNGERREEPVSGGAYLAVWWRTPSPEETWPSVEAFRIGGKWIAAGVPL